MAGLGVGLLAVAVAAGYTGQVALEAICAIFGVIAIIAYLGMALDRYNRAIQYR
jgi:hypothetical protein